MPLPLWVTDPGLSEAEKARALLNYRIRLAALHVDCFGSINLLSARAGFATNYLGNVIRRGVLPRKCELAIRQVVGADVFPTEEDLLARSL